MSRHPRSPYWCSLQSLVVLVALSAPAMVSAVRAASEEEPGEKLRAQKIAAAGPDYAIQGEYTGNLRVEGDAEMFGVQVIARGKGTFRARGYRGGLPGAGWDRSSRLEFEGKTEGDRTVLKMAGDGEKGYRLVIRDRRMEVQSDSGAVVGRLVRLVRRSPTIGRKPPPGATVLFDGTTAEHFVYRRGGKPAQMTPDGLLRLMTRSGGLQTKKEFQSCKLHLEFLLPFEPTHGGQGRANSGCYLQGRYEVQILDSFGLDGRQGECGGIYSSGADPAVNMCFPPLTWQTFDVDFTVAQFDEKGKKTGKARMTVHHNGVQVYADQTIPRWTTAAPEQNESPAPKYLYLQDHGHELWFRNIWLVEK